MSQATDHYVAGYTAPQVMVRKGEILDESPNHILFRAKKKGSSRYETMTIAKENVIAIDSNSGEIELHFFNPNAKHSFFNTKTKMDGFKDGFLNLSEGNSRHIRINPKYAAILREEASDAPPIGQGKINSSGTGGKKREKSKGKEKEKGKKKKNKS